ncbi:MAG TPA: protocatechuate 3,4-dioxygenase [Burkholderiaceae bacterium]|nr:protocatechuate 3,4-dioxygenase [Burkholderiaceae bacterium]HRZ00688.1 protocatechuate 3,4-dioxygenase [Burkholderiaceae bacterium]
MDRPDHSALLARRQRLLALAASLASLSLPTGQPRAQSPAGRTPTPAQSLGPFYPRAASERPRETDADLLRAQGAGEPLARGVPLFLAGRVSHRAGAPLPGALIEIWQCDANAVYHHPAGGALAERDPNFQGYGRALADAEGRFAFRTIRPVPYPGRTPHIHLRVEAAGLRALGTQLYLAGEPGNERDFLYRSLDAAERAALTLTLTPTPSGATHPLASGTRFMAATELVLA